jgi:1,2-diacylglycerol 3-beta-glucosyltransferase
MSKNSWSGEEPDKELNPLASILSDWSDPEEEEEDFKEDFFQGFSGRRRKAAFVLTSVWGIAIALHLIPWGSVIVLSLTSVLAIQSLILVSARSHFVQAAQSKSISKNKNDETNDELPSITLIVAAKNEEAVIANLVRMLCDLDYPKDKYEVWIVDDHSTDRTPIILEQLKQQYKQLKVINRPVNAGGGKSGALNQVLSLSSGEIVGVFDADAKVTRDLLRKVFPLFNSASIGALQVRKAIANSSFNFWTKGQAAEMALDSYLQEQRVASSRMAELRGNGQFVRRSALISCGGWNEQTITDDLDLTIRLHLDNWEIGFLPIPPVEEEGVTNALALWHQRSRWAEGGYQRYLDYWRLLFSDRLSIAKKLDLFLFYILSQYLLPTASIPDFLMAIARHESPILVPLTSLMLIVSFCGMFNGLIRVRTEEKLSIVDLIKIVWESLRGMIYMLHWLIIMPSTTARISVRPKKLKWVKTVHEGNLIVRNS